MESANWIILVLAIIAGVALLMLFRGHARVKHLAADTSDGTGGLSDKKPMSWAPSPADKYLPAWVIGSMSIAVWLLASQVNSVVTKVCATPGRCQTAASAPGSLTDQSGSDEAKTKAAKVKSDDEAKKAKGEAEAKVEAANAAAAALVAASAPTAIGK